MEKIRGDITIESRAGEHEGRVYISQRFVVPREGKEPEIILVAWPIEGFECYLADCYKLLKTLKLKMAEHEQTEKERLDTGTVPSEGSEIKPDESACDRGCELPEISPFDEGVPMDAPNQADSSQ